jgi:hypothetical protein
MSNKFLPQGRSSHGRITNTREKIGKQPLPPLLISLKDFDITQGQTFQEWQEDGLLAQFVEYFRDFCKKTREEARTENLLKVYDDFPPHSAFSKPKHIVGEVKWAVLMHIGGQKARVVGHVIDSTFYIVFLDKDHKFYPTEKKHT